jgi:very-short-patch-repair endonuclease
MVEGPMRATGNSMKIARQQRRAMSPPEVRLWVLLRRSPNGIRFRRQHPIGPYVADFYCPAAKLVIEVDGLMHDFAGPAERDRRRDQYMRKLGLAVVRIPAADVFRDPTGVAESLVVMCADVAGPSTTQLR